jgi:short subunit dehydrogenase-like uncharacterized protein
MSTFMIYGAYGYTGALLAEAAMRRGHRPLLAGRDAERLRPLAESLGLAWVAVDLADAPALRQAIRRVDLVLHAAGPFVFTSQPMVDACLAEGVHYLDITGEVPVFEAIFDRDAQAKVAGIALLPGVGFDVVPTDCMARHVAERLPDATHLELAIASLSSISPGTAKTMVEQLPGGVLVRRDGALTAIDMGSDVRRVAFLDRPRTVMPIPWGDLATAYHTTGIPNINTYMAFPRRMVGIMARTAPLSRVLLGPKPVRRLLQGLIQRTVTGPDADLRQRARSYVWARAINAAGESATAQLETLEGYQFTVEAGLNSVERVLADAPVGALTPALAFGADFVLDLPNTQRVDL